MQYTERLLTGGSCLTRFSHRGRYQVVWNILASSRYERAVDFGCADGWFLKTAYERGIVRTGIGVDLDCNMLEAGSKKFEAIDGFRFIRPAEITSDLSGTCDLAICTETLEHVRSPKEIIDQMLCFCRRGAQVIISVPIEVGPSVFAKQIGRFLSQKRAVSYGYEKYRINELLQAGALWNTSRIDCSQNNSNSLERGHKGFDYRKVDALIRGRLKVERLEYSPIPFMKGILNSTVYWICRA